MDSSALNVQRIVFTGDILRPFPSVRGGWESATSKNVRWIQHLLSWPTQEATGLPISRVSWESDGFDTPRFYESLGLPLGLDAWAALFYRETLPAAAEDHLSDPFRDALVIGVELPDVLQRVLARRGVPFVDVVSHPVRFMDDLLFALRTNVPGMHRALVERRFDVARCIPFANLHRAKTAWMPALALPRGTALLTGQVATDKAVIDRREGRFLSFADFTEEIFGVCERHPRVLFKPHPYQNARCPSRRVIESFGAIETVTENFYYLLGQDAITDVYAISSGTVHEAPYFGRQGTAFGAPLYDFGDRPPDAGRAGACVPIGDALLSPAFWSAILAPVTDTRPHPPAGPPPRPSRLRRSLNADWDHAWIDEVVQQARPRLAPEPEPARR